MSFDKLIKQLKRPNKPLLAVLIDPDKYNPELITLANKSNTACFLLGGSSIVSGSLTKTLKSIKALTKIPVVLFPGDEKQLSINADGLFLPSLLSGRNPDYLIEKQIIMAPIIKKMKLKHLPMAYLLIDGKKISTTQKVTGTIPLDPKNSRKIRNTCLAAEQLGFKLIYLEAGSGAIKNVAHSLIKQIKQQVSLPVIVGGGIDTSKKVKETIKAGANMIVIGNALEKNVYLLTEISPYFE